MHDLILRNIRLLGASDWTQTDLAITDGRFSSLDASSESAKETIDGENLLCFPGGVDLHVHFNEPGRTHWEGFATGSLSAAAGGVTFFAEMPLNSIPSTTTVEALEQKLDAIKGKSQVDFALWGGLVPGNADDLEPLSDAGVFAFKAFMSPSGTDDFENSDVSTLKEGMKRIARTGKFLALHAEDPAILEPAANALQLKESAFHWEASRPVEAEISAIQIAIELSGDTGCPLHIVHVSSAEAIAVIDNAKAKGVDITCETCPHYLLLSIEDAHAIGPAAKCAPPLRQRGVVETLWNSLSSGSIDTIGSDHSPCPPDMKEGKSFYDAWGGISGLQHGLPLLWQRSVHDFGLLNQLQALASSKPAQRAGLTSKGSITLGQDADFTLVEALQNSQTISEDQLHYRHRSSAYCGLDQSLRIRETWLRGTPIYQNGKEFPTPSGAFLKF